MLELTIRETKIEFYPENIVEGTLHAWDHLIHDKLPELGDYLSKVTGGVIVSNNYEDTLRNERHRERFPKDSYEFLRVHHGYNP